MSIDAVFAQFFDNIHDPRQHAKIYYPFYDVLFLTVCAVIGGAYLFTRTGLTASVLPGWDNLSSRCTP